MIPVALPFAILCLAFLILTGLTLAVLVGSSRLAEFVRARILLSPASEGPALEGAAMAAAGVNIPRVEGYSMPESLHYHRGHAWVAVQESGTALIGIDDFAGKLFGRPTSVSLPRVGESFKQGMKGWTLSRKGKHLDMAFPLDGEVVAVNELAMEAPDVLSEEPYGRGWLVMVKPKDLGRNLGNRVRGSAARRWMEESAMELRSVFSGELGLVFQDGGLPEEGVADRLEAADWHELVSRVFTVEPEKSGQ
jgi:glycine cleavage system H protein